MVKKSKKKKKLFSGVYGEKYCLAYKLLRFTEKPPDSSEVRSIINARTFDKLSVNSKEMHEYRAHIDACDVPRRINGITSDY